MQSCLQDANATVRDEALRTLVDILELNEKYDNRLVDAPLAAEFAHTVSGKLLTLKISESGADLTAAIDLMMKVKVVC